MAVSLLSHAALPALTYPGILEVPSQAHEIFVSITAKEPQLQNPEEWLNSSGSSQKGKLLQKTLIICLFELICNPQAAQYYFVTHNINFERNVQPAFKRLLENAWNILIT